MFLQNCLQVTTHRFSFTISSCSPEDIIGVATAADAARVNFQLNFTLFVVQDERYNLQEEVQMKTRLKTIVWAVCFITHNVYRTTSYTLGANRNRFSFDLNNTQDVVPYLVFSFRRPTELVTDFYSLTRRLLSQNYDTGSPLPGFKVFLQTVDNINFPRNPDSLTDVSLYRA